MSEIRSIMVTKEEPCKDAPFINKFQEAHNEAIRYFTEEKGLTCVTSYEWNKKINELCGYDILDEGDSIHGVDLSLFQKEVEHEH